MPESPAPSPCLGCPWNIANHGRPHPDGWYTKANRNRLWAKLRTGDAMSCHRTDPSNPVSERAQAAGYRPAPDHAETRECVGALILQQREAQIFNDMCAAAAADGPAGNVLAAYRRVRPRGLTREGLLTVVNRLLFGGVPVVGGLPMPTPDLNADVGHDPLPWTPRTDKESPR